MSTYGFRPPALGPGAVYLPPFADWFRAHDDLIRAVEVEPQPLWVKPRGLPPIGSTRQLAELRSLRQPFLLHGIGSPLGGLNGGEDEQLPEFRRWAETLGVTWISEHLSLLHLREGQATRNAGFLLPPLQTDEYVNIAAANIRRRAAALGRPVAFETGVNYFAPRAGEMSDGAFWRAIAEEADCGILLDLNNLWVNEQNGRQRVADVLAELPLGRVWEVHLAGAEQRHGFWLDAHGGPVHEEVRALAREILPHLGNLAAVIFEVLPDRAPALGEAGFMAEIEFANALWEARGKASPPQPRAATGSTIACSAAAWEAALSDALTLRQPPALPLDRFEDLRSLVLYEELIDTFRCGVLSDLLGYSTRLLFLGLGTAGAETLFRRYCTATTPCFFSSEEARQFAEWMLADLPWVPGLADMLRFEAAAVEAIAENSTIEVTLGTSIETLACEIDAGRVPDPPAQPVRLEISIGDRPQVRALVAA